VPGTLYLVATPIGNLKDITRRAIEVLESVDVIACEDTRHTRKLLTHLGISKKLVSYHEHNEAERAEELAGFLRNGSSVALVSDAGTPAISDPGFRLVRSAIEAEADVIPIPGPVAFISALIASGLPADAVFFDGFLPSKRSERRRRLEEIRTVPATLVFYESPRRIPAALADCLDILGDRQAVVSREITKLHEEFVRGTLSELHSKFSSATLKGEVVLLIDRVRAAQLESHPAMLISDRVAEIEAEGNDRKTALKRAAKEFGISKSEAYRLVQVGG
jgi:16S rRNA (cytidine1402-2'-O)-methyltransferase